MPQATEELIQVRAPHFCAGLVIEDGRCTEAAPILRRTCMGRGADELREAFKRRGWRAVVVEPMRENQTC